MENGLDILIAVVLLVGMVKGAMGGFFRQVVSLVGFFVGLLVAFLFYGEVGDKLVPYVDGSLSVARALAFVLLWIGVPLGLSVLAYILTKVVETVQLGCLNRLAGALIGGLKYMVFFSCLLNVLCRVHLLPEEMTAKSRLYEPVRMVSDVLFDACKEQVMQTVEDVTEEVQSGVLL